MSVATKVAIPSTWFVVAADDHASWLKAREGYLTASDVSAILGCNPHKSRNSVLAAKRAALAGEPAKGFSSSAMSEFCWTTALKASATLPDTPDQCTGSRTLASPLRSPLNATRSEFIWRYIGRNSTERHWLLAAIRKGHPLRIPIARQSVQLRRDLRSRRV